MKKIHSKPFYHQLVSLEQIYLHFKRVGLTDEEEKETWDLIEETVHTRLIDAVLERLPSEKHGKFLELFTENPADLRLWDFLELEVADIKLYVRKASQSLEKEILGDILTAVNETE